MIFLASVALSLQVEVIKPLPTPTLFVDHLAIATLKNKKWIIAEDALPKAERFLGHELELTRIASTRPFYDLKFISEGIPGNFLDYSNPGGAVWSGPKPKYPRAITSLNPVQPEYMKVVKEFFRAEFKQAAPFDVELVSLTKVDLDGDGKEEALIEATHKGASQNYEFGTKRHDLSCTLLRHIKNGKPITEPFYFHYVSPQMDEPNQYTTFRAIADLDGDGSYEVVVSSDYYEGQSAAIFTLSKGELKRQVSHGAGA
jgi:hypothetical protein